MATNVYRVQQKNGFIFTIESVLGPKAMYETERNLGAGLLRLDHLAGCVWVEVSDPAQKLPLEVVHVRLLNFTVALAPDKNCEVLKECVEYVARTSGFASRQEMMETLVKTLA
jgi:hypothetical protein